MKTPRPISLNVLGLGLLLGFCGLPLRAADTAPANPGFEDGLSGWLARDTMSQTAPEAAQSGKLGLRITDDDTTNGSSLFSSAYPAAAGQTITVTFKARADKKFLAVYLWPVNEAGRAVKDPAVRGDGLHSVAIQPSNGAWRDYSLSATLPEGTTAVSVWLHSWSSSTGVADFDDFSFTGLPEGSAPLQSPEEMATASAAAITRSQARRAAEAIPDNIPDRKAPPVIILKLDDLRVTNGGVHRSWVRVADYLAERKIKAGFGIICKTLADAPTAYTDWIRQRNATGLIEFWFHGWDHGTWQSADGKKHSEFDSRPLDEQRQRFADSQQLAKDKLGFAFTTFGPPGGGPSGHQDEATAQVMGEDPDMKVWLYPSPIDTMGRKLAAAGKVTILDRVWAVNLESAVGQPNYARFVAGYAQNPDREYFVLQGHPTNWDDTRFAEFAKIIDFLVEQHAVFTTARDYAASLDGRPAQQVVGK